MDFTLTRNGMRTIPENHLEILGILQKSLGDNFYVTGSLSLLLYGVIDRQIKDLDIIIDETCKASLFKNLAQYNHTQPHLPMIDGDNDNSSADDNFITNLKINGIKVDVFKFDLPSSIKISLPVGFEDGKLLFKNSDVKPKNKTKYLVVDGFKILEPKPSIDAKLKYIDFFTNEPTLDETQRTKLQKHLLDVSDYYKWLITKY